MGRKVLPVPKWQDHISEMSNNVQKLVTVKNTNRKKKQKKKKEGKGFESGEL